MFNNRIIIDGVAADRFPALFAIDQFIFCCSLQPVDQLIDNGANPLPVKQLARVAVKVAWFNWVLQVARLNMG
nr:hypothetical protein [Thiolapillus sp.]